MQAAVTLKQITPPDLIQKAQKKYPKEYKKLQIKTLAIAAFAVTAFAALGASFVLSAVGAGAIGSVCLLVSTPFLFIGIVLILKKIDNKTHFWSAKIGEITYLQESKNRYDRILEQTQDVHALTQRAALCCQLVSHGHLKMLETAKNDLEKVIKVDPDNVKANVILGEYHRIRKENDKALAALNKALAKEPQNYFGLLTRGEVNRLLKKKQEAIADFQAVLALNPKDEYAATSIARLNCTSKIKNISHSLQDWVTLKTLPYRIHLIN